MDRRLDSTDRRLLSLLRRNARTPTASLARELGVARTTVVDRIARLEREGVVAGYGVRLGQRLARAGVLAFSGLCVNAKKVDSVIEALTSLPEVHEVSAVSGQYDYFAMLRCESHEQHDRVLDFIGKMDGILQTTTSVVLSRRVDRGVLPATEERRSVSPGRLRQ